MSEVDIVFMPLSTEEIIRRYDGDPERNGVSWTEFLRYSTQRSAELNHDAIAFGSLHEEIMNRILPIRVTWTSEGEETTLVYKSAGQAVDETVRAETIAFEDALIQTALRLDAAGLIDVIYIDETVAA